MTKICVEEREREREEESRWKQQILVAGFIEAH